MPASNVLTKVFCHPFLRINSEIEIHILLKDGKEPEETRWRRARPPSSNGSRAIEYISALHSPLRGDLPTFEAESQNQGIPGVSLEPGSFCDRN
jgi:hypothetical protein